MSRPPKTVDNLAHVAQYGRHTKLKIFFCNKKMSITVFETIAFFV